MRRKYTLIGLAMAAIAGHAQSPAPSKAIAFDVSSVKLAPPPDFSGGRGGPQRPGAKVDTGRLDIGSMPLRDVITGAYRLKSYSLVGPDWMKSVMVNIVATLPAGASEDQIPEMLQGLLAERFGLKAHQETRDQPVYTLVVSKGGPKMKDAVPSNDPELAPVVTKGPDFGMFSQMSNAKMSGDPMKGMTITGLPQGGTLKMSMTPAGIHLESSTMDMTALVTQLTQFLDRPVFDKTGLKGSYQIALDLSMEDMMNMMSKNGFGGGGPPPPGGGNFGPNPFAGGGGGDSSGSSILVSIQQLGLKLEPQKAPLPMLVIDHLEKAPVEN